MPRKYVRRADEGVDLLTVHQEMTKEEFDIRKNRYKAQIKAVKDHIKRLKKADLPKDPSAEQALAVDEFNFHIEQEIEQLTDSQRNLEDELAEMEKI